MLKYLVIFVIIINISGFTSNFAQESFGFAKLQLQMMGAFAEFERNTIRKRQAEGIAKAKERGVYEKRIRKTTINRDEVKRLSSEGLSIYKIAVSMSISRMSVHRILNQSG